MGMKDVFCVIGAGRIGLPISVTLAAAGEEVIVLEKDENKCKMINDSISPFYEEGMQDSLEDAVKEGLLRSTSDTSIISSCNVIISAIGTGVSEDGTPEIDGIMSLVDLLSPHLKIGDTLILKTTLPIGTTRKIATELSSASKLELDEELMVAFCPERIVEGKAMLELSSLPKIVGGIGPKSRDRVGFIMSKFGGEIVLVSNSRTAEMCKLLDNAYRMTRFGFSADVASVAWRNNIDAFEAIEAANHDYGRNNIPLPSIGVSGYCLTKDPYYLDHGGSGLWSAREFPSAWINARHAADWQIDEAIQRINEESFEDMEDKRVVIAGVTYKEDVDDIRMSHGVELGERLIVQGFEVMWWDPVTSITEISGQDVRRSAGCLRGADLLVLTVPHENFTEWAKNPKELELMRGKTIFDGWGIFRHYDLPGFTYLGTGIRRSKRIEFTGSISKEVLE